MKKKPVKRSIILPVIAIVIVLLALAVILAAQPPKPPKTFVKTQAFDSYENIFFKYEINRYPSSAEVSDVSRGGNLSVGVSTDPKNLDFGIVPTAGSFGRRFITLKNTRDAPAQIQLEAYGQIKPFVEFSRNDFTLEEKGSAPVDIIFRTKNGTLTGNYGGEIDIIVKQSKYDVLGGLR